MAGSGGDSTAVVAAAGMLSPEAEAGGGDSGMRRGAVLEGGRGTDMRP